MTTSDNFGYGKATRTKLGRVSTLLPMLVKMSSRWVKDNGGTFHYIEANAGPGAYEDEQGVIEGSPVIALRCLSALDIPYRAVLIDHDPATIERLGSTLEDRGLMGRGQVELVCADNHAALRDVCQPGSWTDRGMIFFDEKGAPKFDMINEIMSYRSMRYIDALVNIPTVTLKLIRRCILNPRTSQFAGWQARADDAIPLMDRLWALHKQRLLVGEPSSARWGWSLIFGSNWQKFPELPRHNLYASDSATGQDCLERISFSKTELAARRKASE